MANIRKQPVLRMSDIYAPTLKEDPSDADIESAKLLVRAGMNSQGSSPACTPSCRSACALLAKSRPLCVRKWIPTAARKFLCRSCSPLSCGIVRAAGMSTAPSFCA